MFLFLPLSATLSQKLCKIFKNKGKNNFKNFQMPNIHSNAEAHCQACYLNAWETGSVSVVSSR